MKNPKNKINITGNSTKLVFAALFMTVATTSIAATNGNDGSTTAYVDSVHQWGAWELDIEPAAGGLQQPTTQALNARDSKLTLRTNSISALAPPAPPAIIITSTPIPTPPVVPVTPPVPTIRPISPNVPIPIGGPGIPGGGPGT